MIRNTDIVRQAEILGISKVAIRRIADINDDKLKSDILSVLPDAKTVIAACLSYRNDNIGNIPPYTRANYYRVLSKMLHRLGSYIREVVGDNRAGSEIFRTSVNSVLNDKMAAYQTGLGYFADNHLIVVNGVGSMTVLGTLVVDAECEMMTDNPHIENEEVIQCENLCSHCGECFAACPTGALAAGGVDKKRCLQHNSGILDFNTELIPYWGQRFFGCSACTDCCPINLTALHCPDNISELTGFVGDNFDMELLFQYNKGDYRTRFRANQLSATWIDEIVHPRNILMSLHNAGRDGDVRRYAEQINRYGWNEAEKKYLLQWCRILLNKEYL